MKLIILDDVLAFLDELNPETSAKIYAALKFIERADRTYRKIVESQ